MTLIGHVLGISVSLILAIFVIWLAGVCFTIPAFGYFMLALWLVVQSAICWAVMTMIVACVLEMVGVIGGHGHDDHAPHAPPAPVLIISGPANNAIWSNDWREEAVRPRGGRGGRSGSRRPG